MGTSTTSCHQRGGMAVNDRLRAPSKKRICTPSNHRLGGQAQQSSYCMLLLSWVYQNGSEAATCIV
jgi:hypothetical protein